MIVKLRRFLQSALARPEDADDVDDAGNRPAVRVAMAALLVEMSRADFVESPEERQVIRRLLEERFALERQEAERLLTLADEQADRAVSLQEFTREIHECLGTSDKLRFLEMMMRIALADGHLDKHERHLLGKIADLLYVPKADYVTLRDRVLAEQGA